MLKSCTPQTSRNSEPLTTLSDKRRSVCNEELGIAFFEAEVLTQTDCYPFGAVMPDRQWSADAEGYRYGFNGMERDDETYGKGNALDFGARIYDSRLGRWFSPDPYEKLYSPIAPHVFSLNNPLYFLDVDGNPVTYTIDKNGTIVWSKNATPDIMKVGNAMMTTKFGEQAFNKWRDAKTLVHTRIDNENKPEDKAYAETIPNNDKGLNEDGQFVETEVVFYEKRIIAPTGRFAGAGEEEVYGAVASHEPYHNEANQIELDNSKKVSE